MKKTHSSIPRTTGPDPFFIHPNGDITVPNMWIGPKSGTQFKAQNKPHITHLYAKVVDDASFWLVWPCFDAQDLVEAAQTLDTVLSWMHKRIKLTPQQGLLALSVLTLAREQLSKDHGFWTLFCERLEDLVRGAGLSRGHTLH